MDHNGHVPHHRPARAELPDALRQAVHHICAQAVPQEAAFRALLSARRLHTPSGQRRKTLLALTALAATLALAVLPWSGHSGKSLSDGTSNTVLALGNSGSMVSPDQAEPELEGATEGFPPNVRNANMFMKLMGHIPERRDLGRGRTKLIGGGVNPSSPMLDSPIANQRGSGNVDSNKWGGQDTREADEKKERKIPLTRQTTVLYNELDKLGQTAWKEQEKRIAPLRRRIMMVQCVPYTVCKSVTECCNSVTGKAATRVVTIYKGGEVRRYPYKLDKNGQVIIEKKITEADSDPVTKKSGPRKEAKKPQVWHQGNRQPTFARVYVGGGNSLDLVSLQVTVTIEGSRARTLVDHIFRNPHNQQLEGTFEYPLPSGASPSYFAMFLGKTRAAAPPRFAGRGQDALPPDALARLTPAQLVKRVSTRDWGKLQEARVVSKEKALESYEEVVRSRIDPALLEYAGGNTFRGRVFPIPPKGYNRVLIAYEELLPYAGDRALYRFPLPGRKLTEMQFVLRADAAECRDPVVLPRDVGRKQEGGRLVCSRTWKNSKPDGTLLFAFKPAAEQVQATSGRQSPDGPVYLHARVRPRLRQVDNATPFASHAVFLLDASLSESQGRFGVNVLLMRKILESDPAIRRFNVLVFNAGSTWVEPKGWLTNTPAGRKIALDRLDGMVLEGATDVSAALDRLARPDFAIPSGTPVNAFLLSDGQITWGEADVATVVARFEARCPYPTRFHCYRTGLGAENLELFDALTRRGGGIFNCFTEADLPAAAVAHRRQCLQVEHVSLEGGPDASDVLVAGRRAAVYPGGELIVAARLKGTGRTKLVIEGTFLGRKVVQVYALDADGKGELAPRGWAEIAVASLLSLNDPKLDGLVTAYCQQFGIASRVASFLILEIEADYKRFNLDRERRQTAPGDLARFLEKMWRNLGKVPLPREEFERFLARLNSRVKLLTGPSGAHVKRLLALLQGADFELPAANLRGAIVRQGDVPKAYLEALGKDLHDVSADLAEAQRRAETGDVDGAVRVLSSVIEEYPARDDALRLVGYRLLDLKQPAHAARLFQRVQRQRPFEPHSYRDLARSLEESGKYGLAAVQYEVLLAGTWHSRFHDSLKQVALEEYARMMQQAIRHRQVSKKLADHFGERLERMISPQPRSDLRVTISWNTDATDVDLWVIEPDGTKCFYQHNRTKNGGELSQDQTQGYGPERYQIAKAKPGVYTILVHYFRPNPNLLAGETHVNIVVARQAGSPQEQVERHTVILKQHNQAVEVCKVKF
jgi:uncharacterized protein YfaP (DUF2135 family)